MTAALRALLAGSIDYAGLFPPASLTLEPALQNYAEYVRSADSWMLGAFILPFAKFDEASDRLAEFDVAHRLRISALGSKTDDPAQFFSALRTGVGSIKEFNQRHGANASIDQIELPLPNRAGVAMTELHEALTAWDAPIFLEAGPDDAERVIATIAEHQGDARGRRVGFKLRTGGVVASAFPSSIQIARALVAAAKHRVPIKFTAGLHHPIRHFHPSVQTKMHGFLNVLGAGVLGAEHNWDVQETAAMLEDEDPASFVCDDETFAWRGKKLNAERIKAQRELVTSLGSCSFDDPREDLRALNLF